ncbi:MAG: gliding motility-associated C-terminal domain-containing protein [Chitinophagales bacterium]|nr:gliding motility-associated C-terminal domain-containing protein [Chitinophagales bacterium]
MNNGCPGAAQFRSVIEIDLCPVVNASGPAVAICENQPAQLTATTTLGSPNYNYQWTNLSNNSPVGNTATVNVTPAATTSYQVQSTDRYGCLAYDTVVVNTQTCTVVSTCDIPAIDAAMSAAGFVFLNVQNQPCSRYYINPNATSNWNTASNQAAAVGAVLFTINNAAENAAVLAAAQAAGYTGGVWIGYTDAAQEGNWVWQDGTPTGYTNWNPGEPNNTTDICSPSGEDAAIMQLSNGAWNDVYINPGFPFISPAQYRSIVEVNLCPVVNANANPTTVCAGVSSQLTATTQFGSPPYTYTWTNINSGANAGSGTPLSVSPTATTSYQVQSQDRYGCRAFDTVVVNVAGGNNQSFTVNPTTACVGENVQVTYTCPSPATATYNWNFAGGTVISGNGQGPYTLQYSTSGPVNITLDVNDAGCISPQVTQSITISPIPTADAGPDVTVCSGGSVQLGTPAIPGLQYQWLPAANLSNASSAQPTFSSTNTSASTVTTAYVVYAGQTGCIATDTVLVTLLPPSPVSIIASGPLSFCAGGSVTLSSNPPLATYVWSNSATTPTINITQSTNVLLAGTDANRCQFISAPVSVTVHPLPTINLVTINHETCYGFSDGAIQVSASGGSPAYNFTWGTTPPQTGNTLTNLAAGSYPVTVTDANNCTATASYTINASNPIAVLTDSTANVRCHGEANGYASVSVSGATQPLAFAWNNGATTNTLANLPAGTYQVTVTDANNCTASVSFTIAEPDPITVTAPEADTIPFGSVSQIQLNVTPPQNTYTYQWSPDDYLSCTDCPSPDFTAIRTMQYTVTVTDQNGCSVTAIVRVNVLADKQVFIPNAFTPDGNGTNDKFFVYTGGLRFYQLRIFNRTGELVYTSNNSLEGWDGEYKNAPAPPGVYVYHLILSFLDGEKRTYEGSFVLLR